MQAELINQIQSFHGHVCPGLAMGIRAAEIALEQIGKHASDEEVVAVVETDMCAVDAIQFLTGCTFGKGNLIHRDYGKNAFTFVRRSDNKAIRILTRPDAWGDSDDEHRQLSIRVRSGAATLDEKARFQKLHLDKAQRILDAPLEQLFSINEMTITPPKKARIYASIRCEECSEEAMETRIRKFGGRDLCIPCFERIETR
jgi:formylmethanofuran dehydrogenase subunit E